MACPDAMVGSAGSGIEESTWKSCSQRREKGCLREQGGSEVEKGLTRGVID